MVISAFVGGCASVHLFGLSIFYDIQDIFFVRYVTYAHMAIMISKGNEFLFLTFPVLATLR